MAAQQTATTNKPTQGSELLTKSSKAGSGVLLSKPNKMTATAGVLGKGYNLSNQSTLMADNSAIWRHDFFLLRQKTTKGTLIRREQECKNLDGRLQNQTSRRIKKHHQGESTDQSGQQATNFTIIIS